MRQQSRKVTKLVAIGIFVVVCAVALTIAARAIVWGGKMATATGLTPQSILQLLLTQGVDLKTTNDRTNILVLGIGGGDHEGPDLTDTILLLSLHKSTNTMTMLSLPRDIWSDGLQDKINSAYHYGEEKQKGGGMLLAKVTIEDLLGIQIHYGMVIDFAGFEKVIDAVGGVDVNVEKAFTDPKFPIAGKEKDDCDGDPEKKCVYETIHFDAGIQHMSGELALKYVRSRHATGGEGSDFARGRRQQDVLVALRNKLLNPFAWFTPDVVNKLITILDTSIESDMNVSELATVGKRVSRIPDAQIHRLSIEDKLINPPSYVYGRYVLIPETDWETIAASIARDMEASASAAIK